MNAIVAPIPRAEVSIRDATLADVPFIDQLQKMHSDRVGFMARSWIEAKIAKGEVIIAEGESKQPVGYCMAVDKYSGREDVGIIHQLNVVPGRQRGFIGATLLKAQFERSAYGCRLYCCWCAQDIEANKFWESMGFVALAYRAGSERKRKGGRVHIFWQKRIREGDNETAWWFPAKTDKGVMRADRIVLPIPLGKHWSDEMPLIQIAEPAKPELPALSAVEGTDGRAAKVRVPKNAAPANGPRTFSRQFGGPSDDPGPAVVATGKPKQGGREKKPKVKADPKLVAAARELRDRWLEHVNANDGALLLPQAKYEVSRLVPQRSIDSGAAANAARPSLPAPAVHDTRAA